MRRGITPVVAIALLLGMTVAASGGAYTFISSAQQSAQEDASATLATTVAARAVTCGRGVVDLALKNTGDTTVSTNEADLYVYESGDLHTSRSGVDLSSYTLGPADLIRPKLFVPEVLEKGTRYTVEVRFPDDGVAVEGTCDGFEDAGASGIWTFDRFENGTAVDDANSNDGTFSGETFHHGTLGGSSGQSPDDPEWVDGRYGTGMEFPGGNTAASQVTVPWDAEFALTGAFTVSCWLYSHGTQDNNGGSCIWNGDDQGWALEPRNNVVRVNIGGEYTVLTANLPHDEWHHFTLVYDNITANGEARLYRDGVLRDSTTGVEKPQYSSQDIWIGRRSSHHQYSFDGIIDEVRVWDRALNASEVNTSMNSHWPVGEPVASWSFEAGNGQTAHDTHEKVQGRTGGAVTFDGTDDDVLVPDSTSLTHNETITVQAWLKPRPDDQGGLTFKMDSGSSSDRYGYDIRRLADGRIRTYFGIDTGYNQFTTTGTAPTDAWTHLAVTRDRSDGRMYLDGALSGTGTWSNTSWNPSTDDLIIGDDWASDGRFNGTIDEVQVYPFAVH